MFFTGFLGTFIGMFIMMPLLGALVRGFGFYTIVEEGTCQVYTLFGKVAAVLKEPGFHFLPKHLGARAFIINWLGKRHVLDMRRDQTYLRFAAGQLGRRRADGHRHLV